jgi:hypothetical protein
MSVELLSTTWCSVQIVLVLLLITSARWESQLAQSAL